MAKPVVFVIGATGSIGASTVTSLSAKYADTVEIRAGVRNLEKADKIKSLAGVAVVQATMGDEKLVQVLSGVSILFINTPGTENRVQLAISTAELAVKAGVKHIVVVSITTADLTDTIFGRQFNEIEEQISKLGVANTIIRLPAFFENYWGYRSTIVNEGTIFNPIDPEKTYTAVAVEDAGKASATILVNPTSYANKTLIIISDRQTCNEMVQGFSAALGKEVKYVRVPYEATKEMFKAIGLSEFHVNGMLELYKLIDSSNPAVSAGDVETFTTITGDQPTDFNKWLAKYSAGFRY